MIVAQASVYRCNATVDFRTKDFPFFPATVNSEKLHNYFENVAGEVVGTENVRERPLVMGAEDFSFFTEAVPEAYFYFVGMGKETKGPVYPPHSPLFELNEDVLPYGAALQASLAMKYFTGVSSTPLKVKRTASDEL